MLLALLSKANNKVGNNKKSVIKAKTSVMAVNRPILLLSSKLEKLNVVKPITKIIDVTGNKAIEYKGIIPARSVVIPGSYTKRFPAGEYQVPCALIIGTRKESTNKKTSLNDALREYDVAV